MKYECRVQTTRPQRLDRYLADAFPDLSRNELKSRLEHPRVNGRDVRLSHMVRNEDSLCVELRDASPINEIRAEDVDVEIVYEDETVIVFNKKPGQVVHPSPGHRSGTIVNYLYTRIADPTAFSDPSRAGVVHRLDLETSGLLVCALDPAAEEVLKKQFKDRKVMKKYTAMVRGRVLQAEGVIDRPIGRHPVLRKKRAVTADGKEALTEFRVIKRYSDCTLLDVTLHTGRTHQIRVHLESVGHPVVGDRFYSRNEGGDCLCLHSRELAFYHPRTYKLMEFKTGLPPAFGELLDGLKEL